MVFSRLVVSSMFLITVILVPVTVPASPAKRAAAPGPVRISESPAAAAASEEASWLQLLASDDREVRRQAIVDVVDLRGTIPAAAAPMLVGRIADDDLAREALMNIGAASAAALETRLASPASRERAAAASLLGRLAPMTWSSRIVPAACAALASNDETGDAKFGVMALLSVGAAAEEPVRVLLGSADDQSVACAVIVLARLGTLQAEDLARASAPLDRLATAWPCAGDDLEVVIEAYAALGGTGERMIQAMAGGALPNAYSRAVALWKACADPNRETWMPRGRRSTLVKFE